MAVSSKDSKSSAASRQDYIWNTLGSIMNAAASVFLLFATIRILGDYWAGVFSIAFAVGQQFQTLGAFEMRPIQSTDVKHDYSFATYFASRVLTTLLMLFCIIGYAFFTNENKEEIILVILVASLKLFDVFEDVFHGAFQQNGHLDIAGKSFFFRSLITTVVFIASLFFTKDLLVSCVVTIFVSLVAVFVLNVFPAKQIIIPSGKLMASSVIKLLGVCFPLFLGAFLAMYLANAPKFALDVAMSKEYQAYYSALFMPALAINLLSSFVFRPLLTQMAECWLIKDFSGFISILAKGVRWILIAFVSVAIFSFFFGIPILNAFFGLDLTGYQIELMILIVGGALNALSIILYYGLVVMRKQSRILLGYIVAAVIVFIVSGFLIQSLGMLGACILYDVAMAISFTVFLFILMFYFRRDTKMQAKT